MSSASHNARSRVPISASGSPMADAISADDHPSACSSRSSCSSIPRPRRGTEAWRIEKGCTGRPSTSNVALAQLDAPDLPGQRLGQLVDELDHPRIRVRRVALADEGGDLLAEVVGGLVALGDDDE